MFLIISMLLSGVCLGLIIIAAAHPATKTQPPNPGFNNFALLWLWPWINSLANFVDPFISWRERARLQQSLHLAAYDSSWEPQHITGLQLLLFLLGLVLGGLWLYGLHDVSLETSLMLALALAAVLAYFPRYFIVRAGKQRQRHILKALPFFLDITTLCVEAGLNLQGALQQAAQYGPSGPLRTELQHVLADIRTGMPRIVALQKMADRTRLAALSQLVAALAQAEQTGSSLGPLLRAQSEQRRSERFLHAEELALKAPVKMLFPLVTCIFPCTFLVIAFPIGQMLFQSLK